MRNKVLAALLLLLFAVSSPAQYQLAVPGYQYQFPRDYFNHPDYRTEWWYYTGNLTSADGHKFGYELTFFREAVSRSQGNNTTGTSRTSIWPTLRSAMSAEDTSITPNASNRSGPGLAGASQPLEKVWNGNWEVQWVNGEQHLESGCSRLRSAFRDEFAQASGGPRQEWRQPEVGRPGHASHYISFTRRSPPLHRPERKNPSGRRYLMDGPRILQPSYRRRPERLGLAQLQLDDNTELMLYRLRHRDGSVDPFSSGTYVDAKGKSTFLSSTDFTMQAGAETYTSPSTHAFIPSRGESQYLRWEWTCRYGQRCVPGDGNRRYRQSLLLGRRDHHQWNQKRRRSNGVGYLEIDRLCAPRRFGPQEVIKELLLGRERD